LCSLVPFPTRRSSDLDLSIYNETDLAPGVCEFEIFLSPDSILDKPIFVVDGFDPGDSRGILSVYNMLTYTDDNGNVQNLADYVRDRKSTRLNSSNVKI